MLSKVHCFFPQALVFVLVVATILHLMRQQRERRPRRVGTMLWAYVFAITLELSYSACLLGSVECDVVTWYVACGVLGLLGLAVLRRDDLIDSTIRDMTTNERELALARARHERASGVIIAAVSVLTIVAAVLPGIILGVPGGLMDVLPLVVAGLLFPIGLMVLGRGNGLGPALISMAIVLVGVVRAHVLASGATFSLADDMSAVLGAFVRGQTSLMLTRPALISVVLAGVAVALCSALFRLPKVVLARQETAPAEEGEGAGTLPEAPGEPLGDDVPDGDGLDGDSVAQG